MAYEPFSKLNHTSENKLSRIVGRGVVHIRHRCAGTCSAGPGLHELGKTCMTPLGHLYVNSGAHWARRCALQSGSQNVLKVMFSQAKSLFLGLKTGGRHSNVLSFVTDLGTYIWAMSISHLGQDHEASRDSQHSREVGRNSGPTAVESMSPYRCASVLLPFF